MPNSSRILLLVRALASGGSERQLAETAKALRQRGWDLRVGCFIDSGIRAAELRSAGVPVVRFPVTSFLSPTSNARGLWSFGRYVLWHRIELTHSFDPPTNMFCTFAARIFGRRAVLTSQRSFRELRNARELKILRITDRLASGIVVNCEALRRHLIADEGIPPERIHLCYNGLDAMKFYPARDKTRPENLRDSLVIGTVCVLRPEKRLDTLLKGFALAAQQWPQLKLLIVGSGPVREDLETLAAELGIRERVVFEAETRDVALWLNRMDVFVLPSRSEALSNSLMEAMACGTVAVASRVGGNPELVRNGETGLLFESGDEAGLAAQLSRLAASSGLRQTLSGAGTRLIHGNFTMEAAALRMEEIYREHLNYARARIPA